MLYRMALVGATASSLSYASGVKVTVRAVARVGCRLCRTLAGPLFSLKPVPSIASANLPGAYTLPFKPLHATFSTQGSGPRGSQLQRAYTVIVGPLAPHVDEPLLATAFSACGKVAYASVRRGFTNGELLSYGYVRLDSAHAVDSALELDQTDIGGQTAYVRALFTRMDEVTVTGLGWDINEQQLESVFEGCGEVVDTKLRSGRHVGERFVMGFVRFSSPQSARDALKLTGTKLNGRLITVRFTKPKSRSIIYRAMKGEESAPTSIYVKNLPPQVNDNWLRSEFAHCGEVTSVGVQRHLSSIDPSGKGNSLGFGYVNFASADAVERALELNGHLAIAGQLIRVQRASHTAVPQHRPNPRIHPGTILPNKVWVSGLTRDVDAVLLRTEFERFGEVIEAYVQTDRESKRSRGFGFVTFALPESVEEALRHDGMRFDGFSIKIKRALERRAPENVDTLT